MGGVCFSYFFMVSYELCMMFLVPEDRRQLLLGFLQATPTRNPCAPRLLGLGGGFIIQGGFINTSVGL